MPPINSYKEVFNISVPTYRRSLSSTEYIWKTRQLAVRVGEIIANKPKKYKGIYSDKIVSLSITAVSEVILANEIYVKTQSDYETRRTHLLKAKGCLWSMLTIADIFLEQVKKSPVDSKESKTKRDEKISKQQIELGAVVDECVNLINGVIKSDTKRYKDL